MHLVFLLSLLSIALLLTFPSFLSLRAFETVFQGQTGCTGPGDEEGILPAQCFSPSFLHFSHLGFSYSLLLLWVLLGKALKRLEVSNAK